LKILILDEEFPYPLDSGKRIRSYHLARALASRHQVTYLAYGDRASPAAVAIVDAGLNIIAVRPLHRQQSGLRFYWRLLRNLASSAPYIVTSHHSRRFQAAVTECLDRGGYDLVICEWAPYSQFVRSRTATRRVVVAHNIESRIWQGYEVHETNPLRRCYISAQRKKVEAFERSMVRWADGITAVSVADAAELRRYSGTVPIAVVENGVDSEYFCSRGTPEDESRLVFTGSMDWRPNQDAAHYFVREIWPILRRARPDLTASIVGRNPPPELRPLGHEPGIEITGTVPDVRPWIAAAAVYVVPLRIGGGSRLKILEALSMGKAVVSTTLGAEGLEVCHGRNILLADGAIPFARAVLHLLEDAALRMRLGSEGAQLVRARYQWDALATRLEEFVLRVATDGTASRHRPVGP
jgi:polysaccharide biosynthesis protein PslH